MELADKWDKLTIAGEPTAFRSGYEQALKDCAKEVRMVRALWEEPTEGTDHAVVPVGIPLAVKRREDVNPQQAGVSSLVERIALDLGEVKATHHDWVGSLVHNSDPTQQRLEYDKHCPACVIKQILEAIKLEALATAPPEQAASEDRES